MPLQKYIDKSLLNVLASYLSERSIRLDVEGVAKAMSNNCGSVLEPNLRNLLYDGLLRTELSQIEPLAKERTEMDDGCEKTAARVT